MVTALACVMLASSVVATVGATVDQRNGDQLLIPVIANGRRLLCAVDSGGGALISLDERACERSGSIADSAGLSGGLGASRIPDQRIHGVTLQIGRVTITDQTIVMRPFTADMSGI